MIKYIATEAQTRTIEVRHDRARVEYAPISGDAQQVSLAAGSALSGDRWLVLYDEEIVVQRRWVARERVRLATHLVIEDRGISGDLRGEQLAIDTTRHMEDDDG